MSPHIHPQMYSGLTTGSTAISWAKLQIDADDNYITTLNEINPLFIPFMQHPTNTYKYVCPIAILTNVF